MTFPLHFHDMIVLAVTAFCFNFSISARQLQVCALQDRSSEHVRTYTLTKYPPTN